MSNIHCLEGWPCTWWQAKSSIQRDVKLVRGQSRVLIWFFHLLLFFTQQPQLQHNLDGSASAPSSFSLLEGDIHLCSDSHQIFETICNCVRNRGCCGSNATPLLWRFSSGDHHWCPGWMGARWQQKHTDTCWICSPQMNGQISNMSSSVASDALMQSPSLRMFVGFWISVELVPLEILVEVARPQEKKAFWFPPL